MSEVRNLREGQGLSRNSQRRLDDQGLGLGKLPPQAIELEEAVLGAMMLDRSCLDSVLDVLKQPESFYDPRHQKIYNAIEAVYKNQEAKVDLLTVAEELRRQGTFDEAGGSYYLSQLTHRVASTAHAEEHARIVVQKFVQRELISISNQVIKDSYDDTVDVFDLLDSAEQGFFKIAEGNLKKSFSKVAPVLESVVRNVEKAHEDADGVSGVRSGFVDLDRITGGWQRQNMIVIAARPGMGKTAFVLSMARNMACEWKIPVALFSLEMSAPELVQRLVSSEIGITGQKLRSGKLSVEEFQRLHTGTKALERAPLFIDDTAGLTMFELRAKCRRMKHEHGIQLIIIDYLQLMTGGKDHRGNREQEISAISRSIKALAKELDVPVIALSQLSRMVENRGGDKKPVLSDLRESGAIEQDADIVGFIYRAEYYGIHFYEDGDEQGMPTENTAELILAKNRHGATDTVRFRFIKHLAKFTSMNSIEGENYFTEGAQAALTPNTSFENKDGTTTVTFQSKMNEMVDDDDAEFGHIEPGEAPF